MPILKLYNELVDIPNIQVNYLFVNRIYSSEGILSKTNTFQKPTDIRNHKKYSFHLILYTIYILHYILNIDFLSWDNIQLDNFDMWLLSYNYDNVEHILHTYHHLLLHTQPNK